MVFCILLDRKGLHNLLCILLATKTIRMHFTIHPNRNAHCGTHRCFPFPEASPSFLNSLVFILPRLFIEMSKKN